MLGFWVDAVALASTVLFFFSRVLVSACREKTTSTVDRRHVVVLGVATDVVAAHPSVSRHVAAGVLLGVVTRADRRVGVESGACSGDRRRRPHAALAPTDAAAVLRALDVAVATAVTAVVAREARHVRALVEVDSVAVVASA